MSDYKNQSQQIKKKIGSRLPVYVVYSMLCGFIGMCIERFVMANASGKEVYEVSLLDFFPLITFFSVFIALLALQILLNHTYSEKSRISLAFEKITSHPLTFVLLAVIAWRLWYYGNFDSYAIWYDTSSYEDYSANIFLGQVDMFRTPIYPWFMKLIGFINQTPQGSAFYENIVHAQILLSFVGVVLMYCTAVKVFKNRYVVLAATFLFGTAPFIISWDLCVLTESLSIFSTVLCLYLVMRYIKHPTVPLAIILGLYVFLMIMLRPTFIYLFAILGVFFVARLIFTKYDRKRALCGLLALVLSGCMTMGYCTLNKRQNDCFNVSSVSTTINKLYMVIDLGIYDNSDYKDITQFINMKIGEYDEEELNYVIDIIEPANKMFINSRLSAYVNDCIAKNKDVFNEYTVSKFTHELLDMKLAINYASLPVMSEADFRYFDDFLLNLTFPFTIGVCFVLVLFTVLFAVYQLIRRKLIVWQPIGLCAIIFAHLFVSIYGSMAEYGRLSVMIVPCVYLLALYYIDLVVVHLKKVDFEEDILLRGDIIFAKKSSEQDVSAEQKMSEWADEFFSENSTKENDE